MWLIVGLGNPEPRYLPTRHNVGWRILHRLAARHGIALEASRYAGRFGRGRVGGEEVGLLEPHTFMNRSGEAVELALEHLDLDERSLLVLSDDLDLPFGTLRLRPSGGAGGHRGLADVIDAVGSGEFPRLRFGIGRPPAGEDPIDWVLAPFDAEEEEALPARVDEAVDALETLLADGVTQAMNRFNG